MAIEVQSYLTQRQILLAQYEATGQRFIASTVPIHSTRSARLQVQNVNIASGLAFAVLVPQVLRFLDYGVGDTIQMGSTGEHQATENDTNLAKAKSTNGAADVVIEGMGISVRGHRVRYAEADLPQLVADPSDAVLAALTGEAPIVDPAAAFTPPQLMSPANLEESIGQAVIRHAAIELEFDRRRVEKLGTLATLPEAGGSSYLRAAGVPDPDVRWRIPEGYRWNRDGEPDSELVVYVRIQEPVVVPINLITAPIAPNDIKAPTDLWVDLVLKLSGIQISMPGTN